MYSDILFGNVYPGTYWAGTCLYYSIAHTGSDSVYSSAYRYRHVWPRVSWFQMLISKFWNFDIGMLWYRIPDIEVHYLRYWYLRYRVPICCAYSAYCFAYISYCARREKSKCPSWHCSCKDSNHVPLNNAHSALPTKLQRALLPWSLRGEMEEDAKYEKNIWTSVTVVHVIFRQKPSYLVKNAKYVIILYWCILPSDSERHPRLHHKGATFIVRGKGSNWRSNDCQPDALTNRPRHPGDIYKYASSGKILQRVRS